ncbi:HMA2 domain-containing protein [Bradyrhizobium sp.]|uniref:HMA2 domain-containing protein n=1 Tax=Bradyrhizobium sp. TaxID=376 RepID=UPI001DE1521B|nr:hypothetical protein [Bradyrhizobium sp.]MBV8700177.1 hypothetical protein [Bradyrhizobium sp.]MBV8919879.1 hypothetical protein [Bradyrhizobium sp.]MBV9979968.1 hypothetical protein [Bradyrhizobium sp.]
MVPIAYVEHEIPGRLRLRVPDRRGDSGYFESIKQGLSKHPGVKQLNVAPATASILLHYDGAAEPITAAAHQHGLFEIVHRTLRSASPSPPAANESTVLPSALKTVANGLAGLALLQAGRGQPFGNAVENFWNAYGAMRILQRPGLTALFAAVGAYQVLQGRYLGSATSLFFYSLVTRHLATNHSKASSPRIAAPNREERGQDKSSEG